MVKENSFIVNFFREFGDDPDGFGGAVVEGVVSIEGKESWIDCNREVELLSLIGLAKNHLGRDSGLSQEEREALENDAWMALVELMGANMSLVLTVARKYRGRGLDWQELVNEGVIGLIMAFEAYDYERIEEYHAEGSGFSGLAKWYVLKAISESVKEGGRLVRLPSNQVDLLNNVEKCIQKGIEDPKEIAKMLNKREGQIVKVLNLTKLEPVGIPENEDGLIAGERISNDRVRRVEQEVITNFVIELAEWLVQKTVKDELGEIEVEQDRVIQWVRGVIGLDDEPKSVMKTAKEDGEFTRYMVDKLVRKVIEKIKIQLVEMGYTAEVLREF